MRNGRYLYHLSFTDDIVLKTTNIEQAERMLADSNALVEDRLETELGEDDLSRRKRTEWEAFKNIEAIVKKNEGTPLRAHFSKTAFLLALTSLLLCQRGYVKEIRTHPEFYDACYINRRPSDRSAGHALTVQSRLRPGLRERYLTLSSVLNAWPATLSVRRISLRTTHVA
ncbi:hypothetical protein V3C99_018775 [Haemonchus contortus]|uniref:Reverse transcriptase domain-containing protein n=1 Tax=Haemonchus contortus TaxID=6289 RepID=A0A7I4Z1F6_HAECO